MDLKVQTARFGVLVAIIVIWQLAPTYGVVSPFVLSPLSKVLSSFPQLFDPENAIVPSHSMLPNFLLTLSEILLGFTISIIVGLGVGFLIGYYRIIGKTYEPLVYVLHAIPGFALYPVLYLTLGLGFGSKVALGVIFGSFPLIINTAAGFRQVKGGLIRFGKSLGADNRQIFLKIFLPAAAPSIMSGLRLSLSSVIVAVISAEILASYAGLGRVIGNLYQDFLISQLYACILLVVGVAVGFYILITYVESKAFPYEK
jgi:NitT/TauT family transport system permease protein